jgi:phospholipid transport system substrate-binding protein
MIMISRRFLFFCLILPLLGGLAAPAARAQAGDPTARAVSFVDALGKEAVTTMADKTITRVQRVDRFRNLFHRGFDIPSLARFALGRYWPIATPVQQQEYIRQFDEMVVRSYAAHFESYGGGSFRITASRLDNDHDVFVTTVVKPNEGPPVNVEWRVRERDGHIGIIDVVIEGVSMSLSERQEFSSVIQAKGGNIDAFLQALREKVATMVSSSP